MHCVGAGIDSDGHIQLVGAGKRVHAKSLESDGGITRIHFTGLDAVASLYGLLERLGSPNSFCVDYPVRVV